MLNSVLREWKRLEYTDFKQEFNLFDCPACDKEPHAVHLVGNAKLSRYQNAGRLVIFLM